MFLLLGPVGVPNESRYLVDCAFGGRAPTSLITSGAKIATRTSRTMNASAPRATLSSRSRRQNSCHGERAAISVETAPPAPGARLPPSLSSETSGAPVVTWATTSTRGGSVPARGSLDGNRGASVLRHFWLLLRSASAPMPPRRRRGRDVTAGRAAQRRCDPRQQGHFVSAVKLTSQAAFALLITAFTSLDLMSGGLSHVHGIAAAVPVTRRSMLAHAFARWAGSTISSALSIIWLSFESFS